MRRQQDPTPTAGLAATPGSLLARDLGKVYRLYARPADRLRQALRPRRRLFHEHRALHGVGFSVSAGETVGLVGQNGSGKSTLLQLLAGILGPSAGEVAVAGRVSALLELGAGFDPDASGEENVRVYGAVLGLTRQEIEERFATILDFADIGDSVRQPVRTYSSGMLVRLAFAVAVSIEPDVLLVDEALAVGDEGFQRKCFVRMEAMRRRGVTILLASHDPSAILGFCRRALLLDRGELLLDGAPREVVQRYHRLLFAAPAQREVVREAIRRGAGPHPAADETAPAAAPEAAAPPPAEAPRSPPGAARTAGFDPALQTRPSESYDPRGARIEDPRVTTLDGRVVNLLVQGEEYLFRYRVRFAAPQQGVRFGMLLKAKSGFELGGGVSAAPERAIAAVAAGSEAEVRFRFACRLVTGTCFLNAGVVAQVDGEESYLHRLLDVVMVRVIPQEGTLATAAVDFAVRAEVSLLPAPDAVAAGAPSAPPARPPPR
ncbi:MAG TPA: ABC transporter ATP-binding protein [Thermoanaerobaculia bacterium]|nr:ABC transporter ATP-binding protein [Thermoanaerobaculia bacterium]